MHEFLGRSAFEGSPAGAAIRAPSYAGQAVFNGCIAFSNWHREEVAAALPAELDLAVNTSPAPDRHPVAFIFGEHTEGATIFGGITFPLGVSYHEFVLAIPFVRHRRGRALHVFVARMYASFFPATWAGNAHYGLAKEMAAMKWRGPSFAVAGPGGAPLFQASVEPAGDWTPAANCPLPNFAAMRDVFALPIIGRRGDDTYIVSTFSWDFATARARPVRAALAIDAVLADGVTPRACSAVDAGAFEVAGMIWRLSWPRPCGF